jgi:putative ABC transport system ATP-binding protein
MYLLLEDDMQTILKNPDSKQKTGKSPIIKLKDIKKAYDIGEKLFYALDGVSTEIATGEYLTVFGKSGSGKSTFLNMITGIDHPTEGSIQIKDTSLVSMSEDKLAKWRGSNIGIVFQFFQLLPTLTIMENILLPMDFCGIIRADKRVQRAEELLTTCGIADQADKLPSALSGGQQQRAAIARALSNDPDILVADEPTGNLDTSTTNSILSLFESLKDIGKTLIVVTHEKSLANHSDRIITLEDGKIIKDARNNQEKSNG